MSPSAKMEFFHSQTIPIYIFIANKIKSSHTFFNLMFSSTTCLLMPFLSARVNIDEIVIFVRADVFLMLLIMNCKLFLVLTFEVKSLQLVSCINI